LKALAELKKKGHKVGQLRFKGKNWFKSFTYNQTGFRLIYAGKRCDTLRLSKIGDLKIRCHRKIYGNIKQLSVKRESSGKWYASLIEELPNNIKKLDLSSVTEDKVVGIDLGIKAVVYDSDNRNTLNPKYLQLQAIKLAKIQRIFSRKKNGSNNKAKYRILLARQHEYAANIRDDFIHKLSHYYVDKYDIIGFEDMDISGLVKDNNLAKEILDASWGKLRHYVFYKAESAGKMCVFVETKGTTYTCHHCKKYVPKKLCDRIHKCPSCGIKIPRDYNSSLEIKYRTLIEIGMGRAESTPAEMEALSFRGQLPSEKQEAMPL
ncbi:MAG: transposase, partial [Nanoarchaeota archaeon]|nr:transposase [Nanoarchaeota archaeon]